MEYYFRKQTASSYDSNIPSYTRPSSSAAGAPHPPYAQQPSFYPKIGGAGAHSSSAAHVRNPPFQHVAPPPSSSGVGIRVSIKPEYRITSPLVLLPQLGEIPRSNFHFDFEFERNVLTEAMKENPNWIRLGIENGPPKATEPPTHSSISSERDAVNRMKKDIKQLTLKLSQVETSLKEKEALLRLSRSGAEEATVPHGMSRASSTSVIEERKAFQIRDDAQVFSDNDAQVLVDASDVGSSREFPSEEDLPEPATSEYIVQDTGNCSPRYIRCTLNQVPCTRDLLSTSAMQLALLVQPLALPHPSEEPIQVMRSIMSFVRIFEVV